MIEDIELPPLPDLPAYSSEVFDREVKVVSETMAEQLMQSYARSAIKADRQQRGGEPVEDGWRLIAVNEVWDALERALSRACNKGYMPDAMGEEWNAFDWTEAPQPTAPAQAPSDDDLHNLWSRSGGVMRTFARALLARYGSAQPSVPDGWQLVPIEPNSPMEAAAEDYWNGLRYSAFSKSPRTWAGVYGSMLAAAPKFGGGNDGSF